MSANDSKKMLEEARRLWRDGHMHDSLALGLQVCEIAILERDFANAADAALLVGRTYFLLGD